MCGKGNRYDSIYCSAGVFRRYSKHQIFTWSTGNLDQEKDPT